MSTTAPATPPRSIRWAPTRWRTPAAVQVALVLAIALGFLLPLLVDSFAQTKEFRPITAGPERIPRVVDLATTVGNAVVLVACAAVLVALRRRWRDLWGPPALLLVAWALAFAGLLTQDIAVERGVVLVPLVIAAVTVVRPGRPAVEALGWLITAVAAISLVMGAVAPSAGRYARPESLADEKAVSSFGILAGVYPSGNNLGLVLAVGLPAVLVLRPTWARWPAFVLVGGALVWTASRTSWLAAAAAIVIAAAWRFVPRWRDVVSALALSVLGATLVVIPLVTKSPAAFTNRAGYWLAGIDAWRVHPIFGWGPKYYEVAARTDELGGFAYHAHNQAIQLLVTGGMVLAAVVGAALVWAIVIAIRQAATCGWSTQFLAALLVSATFEVPLGFVDREMFHPFALVPLCVVLASGRHRREDRTPEPRSSEVALPPDADLATSVSAGGST